MRDASEMKETITFTLDGADLKALQDCAAAEDRDLHQQARVLVRKALGKYREPVLGKAPPTSGRSPASAGDRPSRPPTAVGGLS